VVIDTKDENVSNPVGVLDFGIGGLSVVREITRALPQESIVFLNDNANLWAGYKSRESVRRDAKIANDFLIEYGVKTVVIGCNTATAVALDYIRERNPVPTIGVIEPTARAATNITRNQRIGVIGTNMTVGSNAYPKILRELNHDLIVSSQACPLLVPMIEDGFIGSEALRLVAMEYLKEFDTKNIDTLVLGCTHYSLILPVVSSLMRNVRLVDSAPYTAQELKRLLMNNNLLKPARKAPKYAFFVTDMNEKFKAIANSIFSRELPVIAPRFQIANLN
jgi:glutamate racemase